MDTSAIAQLLQPYIQPDESRLIAISKYIDILVKWNARINLTAVRAPEEMVQRHFGESFFAANHVLSQGTVERVIDLGSGAGFPGVPFAILAPEIQVTLIESNQKKAAFLRELIYQLDLKNAKVFADRGEKYAHTADVVTMRAVESFSKVLPLAIRLAEPRGKGCAHDWLFAGTRGNWLRRSDDVERAFACSRWTFPGAACRNQSSKSGVM